MQSVDEVAPAALAASSPTSPSVDAFTTGGTGPCGDEKSFEMDLVSRLRLLLQREAAATSPLKQAQQQRRAEWHPLVQQLKKCLGQSQHPPPPVYPLGFDKSQRNPPKVSAVAWKSTLQRFESAKARTQSKLASKRASLEDEATKELSFRPQIDAKSQRMAAQFPSFHERQRNTVAWRDNHVAAEREQRRLKEAQALRPVPDIKTPCLCGQGGLSSSSTSSPHHEPEHTVACTRFMEICASTNKSFKIQKKTHAMRRSVDDMLAYGDTKYIRQVERSVALRAVEDAEATFSPRINPQSKKIYKAMVQSGRTGKEAKVSAPPPVDFTFQPAINRKSKEIAAKLDKGQPNSVFDRLDREADERLFKLMQSQIQSVDASVRHADLVKVGRNDVQIKSLLHQYPDCPMSPTRAPPPKTVIDVDVVGLSSVAFIMANFTNGQALFLPRDGNNKLAVEQRRKSSFQASVDGSNMRRRSQTSPMPST
ncbi:hypothetical protein H310_07917 [Aphanomyces invadans]|uniref:Uncharacterized protein n=1 Tax=Aphanomyces invadans TaxID=157072 RepID=A0A024U2R2_9STRA|nr:hypothetical protein H310_07917 [Aphanomyces invadans]ETV99882.1 hypothetical protein H310_07917 [Aphanomyces invadans]|eukprot:XP_008871658.1 hypothetical protein H310_07917 [Aphanomyces invadans]